MPWIVKTQRTLPGSSSITHGGTDAHPGDVILLTRSYISDPEFHGVEVFLPAEKLALLPQGGTDYMSDRNALTNRHCNEFMKTASALEKFPLNMKRGPST